jgi:hypothetical protein
MAGSIGISLVELSLMAKPRIFISSTYYDLRHVRASLETFVQSLGYEPILSEKGDIAYSPDIPLDESCYREAASADMLVLIVGGRYGAERSDSRTDTPHSFYDRYDSITKQEYTSALSNNIPVWILVDSQVYAEYQTFQKNKSSKNINYAHVDSVNIFMLLEQILLQRRNNALFTFNHYEEIEGWLRDQWAGIFRDLLKRTAQSQQLTSLSTQVFQLSEVNKTLKTYLEALMTAASPEQREDVIKTETSRLLDVEKISKLSDNVFSSVFRLHDISIEKFGQVLESSANFPEFLEKIFQLNDGRTRSRACNTRV